MLSRQASVALQAKMLRPAAAKSATPPPPVFRPVRGPVVQPVLRIGGVKYRAENIAAQTSLEVLLMQADAGTRATRLLIEWAKSSTKYKYASFAKAVAAAEREVAAEGRARLQRTQERNLSEKAEPVTPREMHELQSEQYGQTSGTISFGGICEGSYRRGFGGQPFYSSKAADFGGVVVKSDYDSLAAILDKGRKQEKAQAILGLIREGEYDATKFSHKTDRAIADITTLTQVIESSHARQPGVDKLARSCFQSIADGESTFTEEFNRHNGTFFPARTAKRAGHGGQDASRAVFGTDRRKSDKAKLSGIWNDKLARRSGNMSDSSDDEDSV
jgi:hypothetical protein